MRSMRERLMIAGIQLVVSIVFAVVALQCFNPGVEVAYLVAFVALSFALSAYWETLK